MQISILTEFLFPFFLSHISSTYNFLHLSSYLLFQLMCQICLFLFVLIFASAYLISFPSFHYPCVFTQLLRKRQRCRQSLSRYRLVVVDNFLRSGKKMNLPIQSLRLCTSCSFCLSVFSLHSWWLRVEKAFKTIYDEAGVLEVVFCLLSVDVRERCKCKWILTKFRLGCILENIK